MPLLHDPAARVALAGEKHRFLDLVREQIDKNIAELSAQLSATSQPDSKTKLEEEIKRLKERGIKLLRTDETGAVTILFTGHGYQLRTQWPSNAGL